MSKAEKFIQEHTRNSFNYNGYSPTPEPWLTPDRAREAVEIAREEIYKWLEENAAKFVGLADNEHHAIGDTKAFYGTKSLIHYLKQAMKDEPLPCERPSVFDDNKPYRIGFVKGYHQAEIDLDKELNKYFITNNLIAADIQFEPVTQMKKCAQYFFELGMQISNCY